MKRLRKDSIFRLYLLLFTAFSSFAVALVVRSQSRSHARIVSALELRIVELEARSVLSSGSSSSGSSSPESGSSSSGSSSRRSDPPFFVLGSGYNRKWSYLDIEFNDGTWERFYFRPFPSPAELSRLHSVIEHHAFKHYFPIEYDDDFDT